ncbi:MAG: IS200/IS605 family transposase [Candidatus Zixiibacteriota bacterium]|nr:MAG: IS200/IS605 family transposase [candidate division Zixibacteria bacterium]
MATFTQIYYHLIFATKNRRPVLAESRRDDLFRYIQGIAHRRHCRLYEINGADDHLHLLTHLHPSLCLANLVKDIKIGSGNWIRENAVFPGFDQWQDGYAAITVSPRLREPVERYIRNQPEHHREASFKDELRALLIAAGIDFEEKYLE